MRRKLKIGFVDSWYGDVARGSGTTVAAQGLKRALLDRGHHFVHFSPANHVLPLTLSRCLFNLRVLPSLLFSEADVLAGLDWDGCFYAACGIRKPYFVFAKGVLADILSFESGVTRGLLAFQSRLERLNFRAATKILTPSLYSKRRIQALYGIAPGKIEVLPEGLPLRSWSHLFRSRPRKKKGVTILCVARQYPRKRIAHLLEAVHALKQETPSLRLRIVGDGPEKKRLERIARRLRLSESLIGPVKTTEDLAREYAGADIFCLPSMQENFGIVFLEAMAAGLPIVAYQAGAAPEIIRDGFNGLLAEPENPVDLARKLRLLISDREKRHRLGSNGKKTVKKYDWKKVAEKFERIISPHLTPHLEKRPSPSRSQTAPPRSRLSSS